MTEITKPFWCNIDNMLEEFEKRSDRLNSSQTKTQVFKRRWLIVLIAGSFNIGASFAKSFFGQVNDVYAAYFHVSLANLDWLTQAIMASSLLSCGIVAWIAMSFQIGLRKWFLLQNGIIAVACTLLGMSFLSTGYFWLAVVAQSMIGIPVAIGIVSSPLVGVTWFPSCEVGIAMAIQISGISFGFFLGFLVPTQVFSVDSDKDHVKMTSIYIFSFCGALFFLIFAITYLVLRDQPVLPPSLSQLSKRISSRSCKMSAVGNFKIGIKKIVQNRQLGILLIPFSISFSSDLVLFNLLSDIILQRGGPMLDNRSSERVSGLAMTIYAICHLCGSIVAGKVISSSHSLKMIALAFYSVQFASMLLLLLGVVLSNLLVVYFGLAFFGLGTVAAVLTLMEIGSQLMYPVNELVISCVLVMAGQAAGLISPFIFRKVLVSFGYVISLGSQSSLLFLGVVIMILSKPKFLRQEIDLI